jgi:hypothetical protein
VAVFAVIAAIAVSLPAAEKPRKQKRVESYALVAGTVFREPGFALPGAEVVLAGAPDAPSGGPRVKKQKAAADARGEFAFRVPPETMKYVVMVSAKGMKNQEKSVLVQGDERVEVTFMLEPESNK